MKKIINPEQVAERRLSLLLGIPYPSFTDWTSDLLDSIFHEETEEMILREGEILQVPSVVKVVQAVGSYIQTSLDFQHNPLEQLRKYFPTFAWKYINDWQQSEDTEEMVEKTSYLWFPETEGSSPIFGCTCADPLFRPQQRVCWGPYLRQISSLAEDVYHLKQLGYVVI